MIGYCIAEWRMWECAATSPSIIGKGIVVVALFSKSAAVITALFPVTVEFLLGHQPVLYQEGVFLQEQEENAGGYGSVGDGYQ